MRRSTITLFFLPLLALASACGETDASAGDSFTGSGGESGDSGIASSSAEGSESESEGSATDSGGDTSDSTGTSGEGTSGDGDGDADGGDDATTTSGDGDGDGDSENGDGDGDGDGDVCDVLDPVTLYLSPDDSNSMSSPVQVKERIQQSSNPNFYGINVRPWEFMNYYNFDYPAAPDGELTVTAEMQPEPSDGQYRLQIGVASEAMSQATRPPMNLTLVLDTSGSMSGEPMDLLIDTCEAIAASLRPGDRVSMLEWDVETSYTLAGYEVSGANDELLMEKISELHPGGGTNLSGGLSNGYEIAQDTFDPDRVNRVVLVSDGGANAGITDEELIGSAAGMAGGDGIYLVGVGVGDTGYNDELMDTVTDAGKGASVFIHEPAEAWKVFNQNFVNTMAIAARDVQVQLDMPPGFDIVKFSGEEYSGDPTEVEPQHIAPNDAMVFHQVIETCAPESVDGSAEITVTARYRDAWTFLPKEVSHTYTFDELSAQTTPLMYKGAAILAFAEMIDAWDQLSTVEKNDALSSVIADTDYALTLLDADPDLLEIRDLLDNL